VFVSASLGAALSNFVFYLVRSGLLGPAGYGALGALLNVTSVLSAPLGAVSVVVAQLFCALADDSASLPRQAILLEPATVDVTVVVSRGTWVPPAWPPTSGASAMSWRAPATGVSPTGFHPARVRVAVSGGRGSGRFVV
jgi:hypothetical protein